MFPQHQQASEMWQLVVLIVDPNWTFSPVYM